jgi:hypothetical protein
VTYQVSKPELKITVNPFAYRAAMALSTVYLGLLLGVLLLIPLAESRGTRPFEWFGQVQALITALASVATGVLGAFFVSSKPQP